MNFYWEGNVYYEVYYKSIKKDTFLMRLVSYYETMTDKVSNFITSNTITNIGIYYGVMLTCF